MHGFLSHLLVNIVRKIGKIYRWIFTLFKTILLVYFYPQFDIGSVFCMQHDNMLFTPRRKEFCHCLRPSVCLFICSSVHTDEDLSTDMNYPIWRKQKTRKKKQVCGAACFISTETSSLKMSVWSILSTRKKYWFYQTFASIVGWK